VIGPSKSEELENLSCTAVGNSCPDLQISSDNDAAVGARICFENRRIYQSSKGLAWASLGCRIGISNYT
jgi:hypothetical protein